MSDSASQCILCGASAALSELNGLDVFTCPACGLIWRKTFDIPLAHYEEKEIDLSAKKLKTRLHDSYGRIRTAQKYADLNATCDIGTGEGIFLKALKDKGFTRCFGIEPSDQISAFAKKNDLMILKGVIDDVPAIATQHE